jgi:hypothetical protein
VYNPPLTSVSPQRFVFASAKLGKVAKKGLGNWIPTDAFFWGINTPNFHCFNETLRKNESLKQKQKSPSFRTGLYHPHLPIHFLMRG